MSKVFIWIVVGLTVLLAGTVIAANAKPGFQKVAKIEVDEHIPDRGVLKVDLDRQSQYLIDTRFELCFLKARDISAISIIQVPCAPLFKGIYQE